MTNTRLSLLVQNYTIQFCYDRIFTENIKNFEAFQSFLVYVQFEKYELGQADQNCNARSMMQTIFFSTKISYYDLIIISISKCFDR